MPIFTIILDCRNVENNYKSPLPADGSSSILAKYKEFFGKSRLKVVSISNCKSQLPFSKKFHIWHERKVECFRISNSVTEVTKIPNVLNTSLTEGQIIEYI